MTTKLNWETVRAIRKGYQLGRTQAQLSREFNITVGHIGRVVNNLIWMDEASAPASEISQEELSRRAAESFAKLEGSLAEEGIKLDKKGQYSDSVSSETKSEYEKIRSEARERLQRMGVLK